MDQDALLILLDNYTGNYIDRQYREHIIREVQKLYHLSALINDHEDNPQEQLMLESSKRKTIVEIEKRFLDSKINATYKFPLKLSRDLNDIRSEKISQNSSNQSLDNNTYDLKMQNTSNEQQFNPNLEQYKMPHPPFSNQQPSQINENLIPISSSTYQIIIPLPEQKLKSKSDHINEGSAAQLSKIGEKESQSKIKIPIQQKLSSYQKKQGNSSEQLLVSQLKNKNIMQNQKLNSPPKQVMIQKSPQNKMEQSSSRSMTSPIFKQHETNLNSQSVLSQPLNKQLDQIKANQIQQTAASLETISNSIVSSSANQIQMKQIILSKTPTIKSQNISPNSKLNVDNLLKGQQYVQILTSPSPKIQNQFIQKLNSKEITTNSNSQSKLKNSTSLTQVDILQKGNSKEISKQSNNTLETIIARHEHQILLQNLSKNAEQALKFKENIKFGQERKENNYMNSISIADTQQHEPLLISEYGFDNKYQNSQIQSVLNNDEKNQLGFVGLQTQIVHMNQSNLNSGISKYSQFMAQSNLNKLSQPQYHQQLISGYQSKWIDLQKFNNNQDSFNRSTTIKSIHNKSDDQNCGSEKSVKMQSTMNLQSVCNPSNLNSIKNEIGCESSNIFLKDIESMNKKSIIGSSQNGKNVEKIQNQNSSPKVKLANESQENRSIIKSSQSQSSNGIIRNSYELLQKQVTSARVNGELQNQKVLQQTRYLDTQNKQIKIQRDQNTPLQQKSNPISNVSLLQKSSSIKITDIKDQQNKSSSKLLETPINQKNKNLSPQKILSLIKKNSQVKLHKYNNQILSSSKSQSNLNSQTNLEVCQNSKLSDEQSIVFNSSKNLPPSNEQKNTYSAALYKKSHHNILNKQIDKYLTNPKQFKYGNQQTEQTKSFYKQIQFNLSTNLTYSSIGTTTAEDTCQSDMSAQKIEMKNVVNLTETKKVCTKQINNETSSSNLQLNQTQKRQQDSNLGALLQRMIKNKQKKSENEKSKESKEKTISLNSLAQQQSPVSQPISPYILTMKSVNPLQNTVKQDSSILKLLQSKTLNKVYSPKTHN